MRTLILLTLIFLSQGSFIVSPSPIVRSDKTVLYTFKSDLNSKYEPEIAASISQLEANTCLRFRKFQILQSFAPEYYMVAGKVSSGGTCSQEANLVACKDRCSGDNDCFAFDFGNWQGNCCRWIKGQHSLTPSQLNRDDERGTTYFKFKQSLTDGYKNECWGWALGGECDNNPSGMLSYCKKSCAFLKEKKRTPFLRFESTLGDKCHANTEHVNLAGWNNKVDWCKKHVMHEIFHSLGAAHEQDHPDFLKYFKNRISHNADEVVLPGKSYLTGVDDNSVELYGGHIRRSDNTEAQDRYNPSIVDYSALNHVYCGGTWCHHGGWLGAGANLQVLDLGNAGYVTPSLNRLNAAAIGHCQSNPRCSGFTRLGAEFWFKHDRTTVYGKGSYQEVKYGPSIPLVGQLLSKVHYWESWVKCNAFSGRRELQETGTYDSVPEEFEPFSTGADVIPLFDTPEVTSESEPSEIISVLFPAENAFSESAAAEAILKKDAELDDAWLESQSGDRRLSPFVTDDPAEETTADPEENNAVAFSALIFGAFALLF